MKQLFITGAGTGIGKTLVTRLLVRELLERGSTMRVLKPIVTGFEPEAAATSDSGLLLAELGRPIGREELDRISPWRFAAPLAPDMAAMRENREVPFDELVEFCRDDDDSDVTLIEGVGGVMVPIDERHTVLDWIEALGYPAVLVTGSYLGAISHALTALDVLLAHGVTLRGIVVSESVEQPVPLIETAATIGRHAHGTVVVPLPRLLEDTAPPALVVSLGLA